MEVSAMQPSVLTWQARLETHITKEAWVKLISILLKYEDKLKKLWAILDFGAHEQALVEFEKALRQYEYYHNLIWNLKRR